MIAVNADLSRNLTEKRLSALIGNAPVVRTLIMECDGEAIELHDILQMPRDLTIYNFNSLRALYQENGYAIKLEALED